MIKTPKFWYKKNILAYLLWPLSLIYFLVIKLRYFCYKINLFKTYYSNIPIIIVGNITAGGSGKTPFVIWLTKFLQKQGFKPAIISRGYKSRTPYYPYLVTANDSWQEAGDEPLLIAKRTNCPVVIGANRAASVQKIQQATDCNIIISDDGLQHYALARDFEICLVDEKIQNNFLLPAGPLREPKSRLKTCDLIIDRKYRKLKSIKFINMQQRHPGEGRDPALMTKQNLNYFANKKVHAIAGIANPQSFFDTLQKLKIDIIEHPFPDHHVFLEQDFKFNDNLPIIMTEKDAVKCADLPIKNAWYLLIDIEPSEDVIYKLQHNLASKIS
ncbi:MAG: tetraacyldisaccharide 4'-kinase [Gammaproteobacteria bacterium]|nr:tetraacyldisaccharide 4'-kinase [Gammaproteobacteria bacterium]